jgi:hypothetical protein
MITYEAHTKLKYMIILLDSNSRKEKVGKALTGIPVREWYGVKE